MLGIILSSSSLFVLTVIAVVLFIVSIKVHRKDKNDNLY
jgi:hypothetical protein